MFIQKFLFVLLILFGFSFCTIISSVNPVNAGIGGGQRITITGCGFKQYSSVSCIWQGKWAAQVSRIESSSTIVCDAPRIDPSEFSNIALPYITFLDVIFNGDKDLIYIVTNTFTFGPTLTNFSPTQGFIDGGNVLTLNGNNFQDFKSVNVTIDNVNCLNSSIISNTQISCITPPGKFNKDAMVNLIFNNNPYFYLHSPFTFHYGPIINRITPPCGRITGGSTVTLTGIGFNDPAILRNSSNTIVQIIANNIRYNALNTNFVGESITFTTPTIPGNAQTVQLQVFFGGFNDQVSVIPVFRYGPIVYTNQNTGNFQTIQNPTPLTGHLGGGDALTITGCGFSFFNRTQVNPIILNGSSRLSLCVTGSGPADNTIRIVPGADAGQDRIVCFTNQLPCSNSSFTRQVQVDFTFSQSVTLIEPTIGSISYTAGPLVNLINPTRGPYTGLTSVTISGTNLFQNAFGTTGNPGWRPQFYFRNTLSNITLTTIGSVTNDTTIVVDTPPGLWGLSTTVSFDFISLTSSSIICANFPRTTTFTYFYGPTCNSILPTNGWLSGNRPIQINGNGFTETNAISRIRMCISRLNPFGNCSVFEQILQFNQSNTNINFNTIPIRQGIQTVVGGNRIFGDIAEVIVDFNVPSGDLAPQVSPSLYCDNYRYGPVVNNITPKFGPIGPRGNQLPGTTVTIEGSAFNDPLYNSNLEIQFGSIAGFGAQVFPFDASQSDTKLIGNTLWGGVAGNTESIATVFNTCNKTFSNINVHWGPVIFSNGLSIDQRTIFPTNNPNLDLWGVLPFGGQIIQIKGRGFSQYGGIFNTIAFFNGRCLIDGVSSSVTYIDDNTLNCLTPSREFGTNATLVIEFGFNSCGTFSDFYNITAKQRLLYTPRVDSFTPDFGLTSGNQPVTVSGEGFIGWGAYYCFFGEYTNGVNVSPNTEGTSIACTTPTHRGGFNTNVSVSIELYDPNQTFQFDMKVVVPKQQYHYGPICTNIDPISGPLIGGNTVTLSGSGFIDCTVSNNAPFSNCIFQTFNISLKNPKTGERFFVQPINNNTGQTPNSATTIQFIVPQAISCMYQPIIEIYFIDAIVLYTEQHYVECKTPSTRNFFYNYGPVFQSITNGDLNRNGIAYGWIGDRVTITGVNFLQPQTFDSIFCVFNGTESETVSVTDTQIVCIAPNNTWDALVNVEVNFISSSNSSLTCQNQTSLKAGKFHYGPVIDSLTPQRGYVQGATTLTISGFAFDCCGINQWFFMLPNGDFNGTIRTGNTVTAPAPFAPNIDTLLVNAGVRFGGVNFNQTTYFQTLTETNQVLTYYYGPIVNDVNPKTSRLSGISSSVTIEGIGFADPFLTNSFCDFFSTSGGVDNTTIPSSSTDTTIVCPIALFTHNCGAVDNISPRWSTILGQTFIPTGNPAPPPNVEVLPYFLSQVTNTRINLGPIKYGASVTSATVVSGPGPASSSDGSLNSFTGGGLQVTITVDNVDDWVINGSGSAQCIFGNRRGSVNSFITSDTTFICSVPFGAFDLTGTIGLLLNPNFDYDTILNTWYWTPFGTEYSRPYGVLSGFETIVIKGGGFCGANSFCTFGGTDTIQSRFINGNSISCITPPTLIGQQLQVNLQFCHESIYGCRCSPYNSLTSSNVIEEFSYASVETITPENGPTCGQTSVTIRGYGFQFFRNLECQFGTKSTPAQRLNNRTITCLTPNIDVKTSRDLIGCSSVRVLGYPRNGAAVVLRGLVTFEFGVPQATSITPNTSSVAISTLVTVTGEYFNGGSNPGTYFCRWGNFPPQPAQKIVQTTNGATQLVCSTPSLINTPNITVGLVDFDVYFDCPASSLFAINNLKFLFTQRAVINSLSPTFGPEIGGTTISVNGSFAGGSKYFCSFGSVLVSAKKITNNQLSCVSPARKSSTGLQVPFFISIDDGKTLVPADDPFIYQNVKCNSSSIQSITNILLLIVLFIFVLVL